MVIKKNEDYQDEISTYILHGIASSTQYILDLGYEDVSLGYQIKAKHPNIVYYRIDTNPDAVQAASSLLDHVVCANIESDILDFGEVTFDCILVGDLLECLCEPSTVLLKIRQLLKPDGYILCNVSNIQHFSILEALLNGDFQYQKTGILKKSHIRFYTYASFIKLLLDSGLIPQIDRILLLNQPPDPGFMDIIKNGLSYFENDPHRCLTYISAYKYLYKGRLNPTFPASVQHVFPISFVCPTNDKRELRDYLLSSPIFQSSHPHQIIILENQTSAAQALMNGVVQAIHDFVVFVHQDVYLPNQFDAIFCQKILEAEQSISNIGVFGIHGVQYRDGKAVHSGSSIGAHQSYRVGGPFPAQVDSVEEGLFGFRKAGFVGMDPNFGWHLYGADIVCAYQEIKKCAVVLDTILYHNSKLSGVVPAEFIVSAHYCMKKWKKYLPIATHSAILPLEGDPYIPLGEQLVMRERAD